MNSTEIKNLAKTHILHSWAVNAEIDPPVITDVDGVYIIDPEGRKILDFSSQLMCVNVGHKNQKIIKDFYAQAARLSEGLMADIPRLFRKIAKEREERLPLLDI